MPQGELGGPDGRWFLPTVQAKEQSWYTAPVITPEWLTTFLGICSNRRTAPCSRRATIPLRSRTGRCDAGGDGPESPGAVERSHRCSRRSAKDAGEVVPEHLSEQIGAVVATLGPGGGHYCSERRGWEAFDAPALQAPVVDRYGAGDAFTAGLAFGLGQGRNLEDAIEVAAHCGAAVVAGRGPYETQMTASELSSRFADV